METYYLLDIEFATDDEFGLRNDTEIKTYRFHSEEAALDFWLDKKKTMKCYRGGFMYKVTKERLY